MLILILSNSLVILSSYFIARRFFAGLGFTDFLLFCFTLFLAQITLAQTLLGLSGNLFASNIILLELIVALGAFSVYSLNKPKTSLAKPDAGFIFNNKIILLAVSVFTAFFGQKLLINLVNPPMCPDSLQYHLMFPAVWLQNGSLDNPLVIFGSRPTSAELSALSYYPLNGELFFFWLMFPLKNALLADIGEAPFYFAGILAVYSILRKFNLKKDTAFLGGMLWVLIPNLFKQIRNGSQVDVICAALFLLALNNLIILGREARLKNACLFGITLGLLLGTKVLNLYWAVSLLPLAGYYLYKNYAEIKFRRVIIFMLAVAIMIILFGGFTYLRTFLTTGNPFYPVKIAALGRQIFPGFIDKEAFSNLFVRWSEFSLSKMFFSEGLGAQFMLFVLFGTFIPLSAAPFIRRKYNFGREAIFIFSMPLIMFLMYFFVIKAYWVRYFFPYLGVGIIAAFLFLERLRWGRIYITISGLICIFSSMAELAHRNELIVSLCVSALIFIILVVFRKKLIPRARYFLSLKAAILVSAVLLACLYFLNERYNREEFIRYAASVKGKSKAIWPKDMALAWKWLNENTGTGKRIAYTGRSEIYPLFGTKLKNRVFYVSTNDKPGLPHYYSDGLYRQEKNFTAWAINLKEKKADYLFVALPFDINNESSDKREFPIEDRWASEHPELFKQVFNNSLVRIYEAHN